MELEKTVGELLKQRNMTLSTAESCTGGGVAASIVSVPGSSAYFLGGIVAYANEAKVNLLKVSPATLDVHGAVSEETVKEMVVGAMNAVNSDCAIATSGIAGPDGGTPAKPVGTIWIAVANKNEIRTWKQEGDAGRTQNVQNAIHKALSMLCELLK